MLILLKHVFGTPICQMTALDVALALGVLALVAELLALPFRQREEANP